VAELKALRQYSEDALRLLFYTGELVSKFNEVRVIGVDSAWRNLVSVYFKTNLKSTICRLWCRVVERNSDFSGELMTYIFRIEEKISEKPAHAGCNLSCVLAFGPQHGRNVALRNSWYQNSHYTIILRPVTSIRRLSRFRKLYDL
jgi:hypothetical protein